MLRLKGGDPFIFGRGGEEIEKLAEQRIPFQVCPGVTAAAGCSSYAGIPLTHRDHAQSCVFVTGHGKDGPIDLDWSTLLRPRQTVAVYMGLAHLDFLMAEFLRHGADPALPVAIIENGTRANQISGDGNSRRHRGQGGRRRPARPDHHHRRRGRRPARHAQLVQSEIGKPIREDKIHGHE